MRTICCLVLLALATAEVSAEPIPQPQFTTSDSWSYHLTAQNRGVTTESHVTVKVMRVGSDGVVVTQKSDATPDRQTSTMFGLDWSKRRSVNGRETTVIQPLSFPLAVGKTWRTEYTEVNPNPQKLRETDVYPFKVVGWEDIDVPAGKFHALKIESDGRWTADLSQRLMNSAVTAQTTENRVVPIVRASGRYYKCFWYVPEVKRWVKSTEENYSSDGSLNNVVSDELESFHIEGAIQPEAPPAARPAAPSKDSI